MSPVWNNFLESVDRSTSSFQRRMSTISTLLSMSGRTVNLLTDLVQFQLDMANGKLGGRFIPGYYIYQRKRKRKEE